MTKRRSILAAAVAVLSATLLPTQPAAAERTIASPLMVSGILDNAAVAPGSQTLWASKGFGKSTSKLVAYGPDAAAWSIDDSMPGVHSSDPTKDLAMASDTDGWALAVVALWRWDNGEWTRHSRPRGISDARWAVTAAPNDVWLTGWNGGYDGENCVWHWDGDNWQRFVFSPGSANGQTQGIVAVAPDNVWAIEQLWGSETQRLWHWDGATWTHRPIPGVEILSGLAANASGAWVKGSDGAVKHWDGQSWTVLPTSSAYELVAAPDGTLWGYDIDGLRSYVDGAWATYPYPDNTCSENRTAELRGIAVRADGGVYLTGTCYGNYGSSTLAYLFDGETFTRI